MICTIILSFVGFTRHTIYIVAPVLWLGGGGSTVNERCTSKTPTTSLQVGGLSIWEDLEVGGEGVGVGGGVGGVGVGGGRCTLWGRCKSTQGWPVS